MGGPESWAAHNGTQVQLLFVGRRLAHGITEDDLVGSQVPQAFRTMCGALAEAVVSVSGAAPAANEKQLLVSVICISIQSVVQCRMHCNTLNSFTYACRMQYKASCRLLRQQALLVMAN